MKKVCSVLLGLVLVISVLVYADYATNGKVFGIFKNEEAIEDVPKNSIDDEVMGLSSFTLDSNENACVTLNGDVYEFTTKATTDNLLQNSIDFKTGLKGELADGYDYVEFQVKVKDFTKIYLSTGSAGNEQVDWRWYDVNGYVIKGVTSLAQRVPDDDNIITVSLASSENTYNVRIGLKTYYQHKALKKTNARLMLAYVGQETVAISNIRYVKEEHSNATDYDNIIIYRHSVEYKTSDSKSNCVALTSGIIETDKRIDRIYINNNAYGVFELEFSEYEFESVDYKYFRYDIKAQDNIITSGTAYLNGQETIFEVFIVYSGRSIKVDSQVVYVKGYMDDEFWI